MTDIRKLVDSRDSSHGPYKETARIAQTIKGLLHSEPGWNDLTSYQKEAFDMVASKLGRIMAGDQNFKDHYVDCAGYFLLVLDQLDKDG